MTRTPDDLSDVEFRPGPRRRGRRTWLWGALGIVVVGSIVAMVLAPRTTRVAQRAVEQRQRLLQFGAALKQYADANGNALPEQVPPTLRATDEAGRAVDAAALLAGAESGSPITYRAVTPGGESVGYEQYGERAIAWSDADERGNRLVLLNSLDEVRYVRADLLDLAQQRLAGGDGGLNQVRSSASAPPRGVASAETDDAEDDEAAPTTDAGAHPATRDR